MKFINDLIKSFNYAVNGIIYSLKHERNMKVHLIISIIVLLFGTFFSLDKLELLILFITMTLVFFTEMINTAIEGLSDLVSEEYHPMIKIIKDIAAGAVLITALNAIVVGYIIFFKDIQPLTLDLLQHIQQTPIHLTFISLILIILIVIGIKSQFNKGTPLQGGMPSGHSALAFGLMIIISNLANDALITTLALLMAVLIAQSRIEGEIHTPLEVISGAIIGSLVGILVFQLVNL
ncbi:diacylglycerol kinase (ATP) [Orenia metallireducens]|jgi:diacylglycerol kinase (ATP)|uniref:Diacylglycerol kinase (ATP) n=1 Tax=Orenia metallireducens TaxID=1413210 RepID=A0A285G637_9FIRM|nr:diacylglycerol kinase [Orenia metallireducens]PRX28338.1 diacylglycerol kinase (ATP) [Orenia metallireducens]SNY18838.1 diacylglycerol kinase (ATP) [Orenia metallireducens]